MVLKASQTSFYSPRVSTSEIISKFQQQFDMMQRLNISSDGDARAPLKECSNVD